MVISIPVVVAAAIAFVVVGVALGWMLWGRRFARLRNHAQDLTLRLAGMDGSISLLTELERSARAENERLRSRLEILEAMRTSLVVELSDRVDLQRIKGIGPKLEDLLVGQGIRTLDQLAHLQESEIDRLSTILPGFGDRIRRERWVEQAALLIGSNHAESLTRL